jgi:hypothetical protein
MTRALKWEAESDGIGDEFGAADAESGGSERGVDEVPDRGSPKSARERMCGRQASGVVRQVESVKGVTVDCLHTHKSPFCISSSSPSADSNARGQLAALP